MHIVILLSVSKTPPTLHMLATSYSVIHGAGSANKDNKNMDIHGATTTSQSNLLKYRRPILQGIFCPGRFVLPVALLPEWLRMVTSILIHDVLDVFKVRDTRAACPCA